MQKTVVITGVGVASPVGTGKEAYWNGLSSGASVIAPISLFDTSGCHSSQAAEVKTWTTAGLPGRKEQWNVSRSITLGAVAAKLALDDARITIDDGNRHQIGVVYGATLACLNVMARFDQQSIREGPRSCDPGMFPDTGVGAPACRVSIAFGATAFNATLSNGATSSLDAIQYGVHFIRMGRAHTVLAGGVEELCLETFHGYDRLNLLSDASIPFDRRRTGMVLGEGSAVLVLEEYEHAVARGATILAEVRGYGTSFDPNPNTRRGPALAMHCALRQAAIRPDQVDLIAAAANSTREGDRIESQCIAQVFASSIPPVTALKSTVGETQSAAGALHVAAGILAMQHGAIPPTINYEQPDPDCTLPIVTKPVPAALHHVLVNTFGSTGVNASLVISTSPDANRN